MADLGFFAEPALGFFAKLGQERLGALARVGHTVFQHEVREVAEAEHARFLLAQFQNPSDQGTVVVFAGRSPSVVGAPHLLPNSAVIEIGHHGVVARRLQREAPAAAAFGFGGRAGGGDG